MVLALNGVVTRPTFKYRTLVRNTHQSIIIGCARNVDLFLNQLLHRNHTIISKYQCLDHSSVIIQGVTQDKTVTGPNTTLIHMQDDIVPRQLEFNITTANAIAKNNGIIATLLRQCICTITTLKNVAIAIRCTCYLIIPFQAFKSCGFRNNRH